ncbi:MAG: methyltransferase domain-containing protein [Candidatus Cloacimonetes bacterium]|nr:methyltransferase domain-containing protein [Candidatus Cloacimonadota bacterium]
MKIFCIPGIDADFFQHDYSQAVSSDANHLYFKARELLLNYDFKQQKFISNDTHSVSTGGLNKGLSVLDLGTGNGILLLMLAKDFHDLSYSGIEIIDELVDIAKKNFLILSEYLGKNLNYQIIKADYCQLTEEISKTIKHDIIMSNPPYYPVGQGKISQQYEKAISRFEIIATLPGLVKCIKNFLSMAGIAIVIYPQERSQEMEKETLNNNLKIINMSSSATLRKGEMVEKSQNKTKNIIFELKHA